MHRGHVSTKHCRALANITNAAGKATQPTGDVPSKKDVTRAPARTAVKAQPVLPPAATALTSDWDEPERLAGPSGAEIEAAQRAEDTAQALADGKMLADLFEARRTDADTSSELSYDHIAPLPHQSAHALRDVPAEEDELYGDWAELPDLAEWACFDKFHVRD